MADSDSDTGTSMDFFKEKVADFFNAGQFTDFTIVCAGHEYKVHRLVISSYSKDFERACLGDFQEGGASRIELKDDDSEAVERMIGYFYKGTYDHQDCRLQNAMQTHAGVIVIAEKYDVLGLKFLAKERYNWAVREARLDSLALARAAHTVYHDTELPERDLATLKGYLVAFWILVDHRKTRAAELAGADAVGNELRERCETNTEFFIDVQRALLKGLVRGLDIAKEIVEAKSQ